MSQLSCLPLLLSHTFFHPLCPLSSSLLLSTSGPSVSRRIVSRSLPTMLMPSMLLMTCEDLEASWERKRIISHPRLALVQTSTRRIQAVPRPRWHIHPVQPEAQRERGGAEPLPAAASRCPDQLRWLSRPRKRAEGKRERSKEEEERGKQPAATQLRTMATICQAGMV
eukprot:766399-Hanusia_phi.AAC.2